MKKTMLAITLLTVAGCTAQADTPPQLGVREARDLARVLEGKVPGEPVNCIPSYRSGSNLRALGDNTLIYRVNKDLVYRNNLEGACNGLAQGDALVLTLTQTQYCRGDIARVVNLQAGVLSGSCALGSFVPYRTAGK